MNEEYRPKRSRFPFVLAIVLIIVFIVGWHLLVPLLGITLAIGAGAWGFVVAAIGIISIAIVLFFIFSGIFVFLIGLIAAAWTILVIVLFPVLFPILAPLLVIVFLVGFFSRRR